MSISSPPPASAAPPSPSTAIAEQFASAAAAMIEASETCLRRARELQAISASASLYSASAPRAFVRETQRGADFLHGELFGAVAELEAKTKAASALSREAVGVGTARLAEAHVVGETVLPDLPDGPLLEIMKALSVLNEGPEARGHVSKFPPPDGNQDPCWSLAKVNRRMYWLYRQRHVNHLVINGRIRPREKAEDYRNCIRDCLYRFPAVKGIVMNGVTSLHPLLWRNGFSQWPRPDADYEERIHSLETAISDMDALPATLLGGSEARARIVFLEFTEGPNSSRNSPPLQCRLPERALAMHFEYRYAYAEDWLAALPNVRHIDVADIAIWEWHHESATTFASILWPSVFSSTALSTVRVNYQLFGRMQEQHQMIVDGAANSGLKELRLEGQIPALALGNVQASIAQLSGLEKLTLRLDACPLSFFEAMPHSLQTIDVETRAGQECELQLQAAIEAGGFFVRWTVVEVKSEAMRQFERLRGTSSAASGRRARLLQERPGLFNEKIFRVRAQPEA